MFKHTRRKVLQWAATAAALPLMAGRLSASALDSVPVLSDEERMRWWKDAKFGLFLHWGLYSVAAGEWNGKPVLGAEHFMLYQRIPLKQYALLARGLTAEHFDASAWVRQAKDAGMGYIVITAKHHEGFAMFDSPSSGYNIVKQTPFARDPMKELAAACLAQGIKLCFYYSLGRDWEDPDVTPSTRGSSPGGQSNTWDFPDNSKKVFARYFERKVKPQIRELLTQYGPIGVLWFDTPEMISADESRELKAMIRSLQPACIVDSRIGNGLGDFETAEQKLIPGKSDRPWESCITMSRHWGYFRNEKDYKSPELLIRDLVDVVSRGGNLLLDIGPTPQGEFPEPSVEALKVMGRWMHIYGEAIYGTRPLKIEGVKQSEDLLSTRSDTAGDAVNDLTSHAMQPEIRFTSKDANIYLFAVSWRSSEVILKTLSIERLPLKRLEMLGELQPIRWTQSAEGLTIHLPPTSPQDIPTYAFKLYARS